MVNISLCLRFLSKLFLFLRQGFHPSCWFRLLLPRRQRRSSLCPCPTLSSESVPHLHYSLVWQDMSHTRCQCFHTYSHQSGGWWVCVCVGGVFTSSDCLIGVFCYITHLCDVPSFSSTPAVKAILTSLSEMLQVWITLSLSLAHCPLLFLNDPTPPHTPPLPKIAPSAWVRMTLYPTTLPLPRHLGLIPRFSLK